MTNDHLALLLKPLLHTAGWRLDQQAIAAVLDSRDELLAKTDELGRHMQPAEPNGVIPVGPSAVDCFAAVNALIKTGDLGGNGCDMNAQRNGLILAANTIAALLHPSSANRSASQCWCHKCSTAPIVEQRMILCPDCGNKRCPKASDHTLACTNSNESGQPGSVYK